MKKTAILILLAFILSVHSKAQMALGTFKDYLPYRFFRDLAVGKDVVYASTTMSLMLVDKKDGYSLSTWSKVDGLSDVGIAGIEYSKEADLLIVAYNNSNIDIIKDQKLINITDIKNKQMSGAKTIHDITTYGKQAYLSCSFGVVIINLDDYLVEDTWFTTRGGENYSVLTTIQSGDYIYMSTDKGIFYTLKSNYQIADFSTWQRDEIGGNEPFDHLYPFKDKVLTVKKEGSGETVKEVLYIFENGAWRQDTILPIQQYKSFDTQGDELLICDFWSFYVLDEELNIVYSGAWYDGLPLAAKAQFDGDDIWIADQYVGLAQFFRNNHYARLLQYGGPCSELTESIDYVDGVLALVPGTRSGWGFNYHPGSVSWMEDNHWDYNGNRYAGFTETHDFNKVVINPNNSDEFYVGAWGGGLFKFVNGEVVAQYTDENAPFAATNGYVLLSALGFDKKENLWLSVSQDNRPLKKMDKNGNFTSYSLSPYVLGVSGEMAEHLLVDSRDIIWITYPRSHTLIIFREGVNGSANKVGYVDLNSAADISTTTVTAIAEDKEGRMWIGTEQGVKVVYNASNAFNRQLYAQNILISQLEYTEPLLQFEQITCIAVDGGNRKWIGTAKAGVFLMSADGTEELLHLTAENSPLFSNQITAIKINPDNGEVYIGTSSGMLSYKGFATEGKEDYSEVFVYPNPVKDGYEGDIAVSGLMENSFCKIADAAGKLVWQGYAYGGQFIWNGKDYKGNKVATGVYFVFASDKTGKEKTVAKILIVR